VHYLFLDETYRNVVDRRTIVVAFWAVEQGRLNDRVRRLNELRQPGKAPILKRIDSTLESLDALALVARARLDKSLFRTGVIDSTNDIRAMARPDTIWSISVIFGVGYLIKQLSLRRQHVGTVDVYFDPRRLRADHATALEKSLRENLVSEARCFSGQLGSDLLRRLHVRRITPVEKPQKDAVPNKFQVGTWFSHKLCTKSDELFHTGGRARIRIEDMTDVITRTVQQWEGKSFYE